MKNTFKHILIYTLVLMFVLGLAVPSSQASFADDLPYADDYVELAVWVNGSKTKEVAYTIKGNIYVKLSTLEKYGDVSKFTKDIENGKLLLNLTELSMNFGDQEVTEFIQKNAGEVYIPIKTFKTDNSESDSYVSLGPVAQIAKLLWTYSEETLYIIQYSQADNLATTGLVSSSTPSLSNKSIAELSSGEKVLIVGESNAFYKVKNASGNSYYVNKDEVKPVDDTTVLNDFEYVPSQKSSINGKINLAFQNLADDAKRTGLPINSNGAVDVLAPPWMHQVVNGKNGAVQHIIDYGYIQLAHQMGMKVWIVANNMFTTTGSTKYTTKVMSSETLSNQVIAKYLFYACINEADGICLDYEDLLKADRDAYTDFNLKLAKYCDMLGLTYSVCTSIPTSYNSMYNWEELGKNVDYIIPMTYVEHMGNVGSQASEDIVYADGNFDHGNMGSVSSYKWYSAWMNKLKELVPANKILMGVPFFSRYYYVDENNMISGSGNITMSSARNRIKAVESQISWSETDQQYVVTYKDEEGTDVHIWLEDPHSLAVRMNYVLESGIGGTACWAIEQIDSETLQMFKAIYKDGVEPSTYYYPTYYND